MTLRGLLIALFVSRGAGVDQQCSARDDPTCAAAPKKTPWWRENRPGRCAGSAAAAAAAAAAALELERLRGAPRPPCARAAVGAAADGPDALQFTEDPSYRLADCVREMRRGVAGAPDSLCRAYLACRDPAGPAVDARALLDALAAADAPVARAPCAPHDALVVHVRLGDWLRSRPDHVVAAAELGAWLRAWARPAECRGVLLVAGLAVRRRDDAARSRDYVAALLAEATASSGLPARVHSSASADADFKVLATARWLLVGAGGFGLLAGAANARGDVFWDLARVYESNDCDAFDFAWAKEVSRLRGESGGRRPNVSMPAT